MKARSVLTLRLNDSSCFDLGWFIIMSHSPLAYWLQFYMIQLLVLILFLKRHQSQLYPFHTFYSNYLSAADSLFHSINYSEMNVARVRKKRNGRIWRIFWKFEIFEEQFPGQAVCHDKNSSNLDFDQLEYLYLNAFFQISISFKGLTSTSRKKLLWLPLTRIRPKL